MKQLNAVKFKDVKSFNKNKTKANVKRYYDSHRIIVFEDAVRVTPDRQKVSHVHRVTNLSQIPTDEIIIYAKNYKETLDQLKSEGIKVKRSFPQTGTIIAYLPEHIPFTDVHKKFIRKRHIDSVHHDVIRDYTRTATDFTYNDQWGLVALRCQEGWDLIDPLNPTNYVAVFDTACETTHPDLVGWTFDNYNHATNTPNVEPTAPDDAHGTSCAGVICANPVNGIDTIGHAGPKTKVTFQSIGIWYGGGQFSSADSWQVAAVNYVIQNPLCVAISMSYSGQGQQGDARDQVFAKARIYGRGGDASTNTPGLGTLSFGSMGNGPCNGGQIPNCAGRPNFVTYPAWYDSVLGVSATSNQGNFIGKKANWSDYGPKTFCAGPGERVPGTDLTGAAGYNLTTNLSSDTCLFGGTSCACPVVAAVAGAVAAANPTLTADQIQDILALTCNKIGGYDYNYNPSTPEKCLELGYGQVDLYAAVSLATGGTIPPGPVVLPDLRVVINSPTIIDQGADMTITYTLSLNTVAQTDINFDVKVFYSLDATYDPADPEIVTKPETIAQGDFFKQGSYTFTVPNTLSGDVWFGVFADSTNVIDPEPELNNVGIRKTFVQGPVVPVGLNLAVEIDSLAVDSVTGIANVRYRFTNTGAVTVTNFRIRKGFDGLNKYEYLLYRTIESEDRFEFDIPWTDVPDPNDLFTTPYRIEILAVNGVADDVSGDDVAVALPDVAVPSVINI